jgi:NADH:ubiquinone oxidoreductase subunit C
LDILINYTLIDYHFDEKNLHFKEILVFLDYSYNLEIAFIEKNSEIERNSEIVASAYLGEHENYDLFGIGYKGHRDLRSILT